MTYDHGQSRKLHRDATPLTCQATPHMVKGDECITLAVARAELAVSLPLQELYS